MDVLNRSPAGFGILVIASYTGVILYIKYIVMESDLCLYSTIVIPGVTGLHRVTHSW